MDFKAQARELVKNLGGRMNASPYDTAWLARLPADNGEGERWPDLIDWLLEHQRPDGSWGGEIAYYHDRILCTLMALITLKERERAHATGQAIRRGEDYIWRNLHFLHHDPIELVGFELIFPTLLAQARALDLDVPAHSCGYGSVRAAKLRLLPADSIYTPARRWRSLWNSWVSRGCRAIGTDGGAEWLHREFTGHHRLSHFPGGARPGSAELPGKDESRAGGIHTFVRCVYLRWRGSSSI